MKYSSPGGDPTALVIEASPARVDRFHLSRIDGETLEAGWKLAAVEKDALGGLNGAEVRSG